MVMPAAPRAHLVIAQPEVLLALREAARDRPAHPAEADQHGRRCCGGGGGAVALQLARLRVAPQHQPDRRPRQPVPHRDRADQGEVGRDGAFAPFLCTAATRRGRAARRPLPPRSAARRRGRAVAPASAYARVPTTRGPPSPGGPATRGCRAAPRRKTTRPARRGRPAARYPARSPRRRRPSGSAASPPAAPPGSAPRPVPSRSGSWCPPEPRTPPGARRRPHPPPTPPAGTAAGPVGCRRADWRSPGRPPPGRWPACPVRRSTAA